MKNFQKLFTTVVLAIVLTPTICYNIYKYKCRTTKAFEQH